MSLVVLKEVGVFSRCRLGWRRGLEVIFVV